MKTYAGKFSFLVNCFFFLKKKILLYIYIPPFSFFFFLIIDQAYRHPMEHIAPMHEDNYYHQQNINQVNRLLLSSILFYNHRKFFEAEFTTFEYIVNYYK